MKVRWTDLKYESDDQITAFFAQVSVALCDVLPKVLLEVLVIVGRWLVGEWDKQLIQLVFVSPFTHEFDYRLPSSNQRLSSIFVTLI
jgi:hypothetical protein